MTFFYDCTIAGSSPSDIAYAEPEARKIGSVEFEDNNFASGFSPFFYMSVSFNICKLIRFTICLRRIPHTRYTTMRMRMT